MCFGNDLRVLVCLSQPLSTKIIKLRRWKEHFKFLRFLDLIIVISWLKQIWSCKSCDREMPERDSLKMARKFNPALTEKQAKVFVTVS